MKPSKAQQKAFEKLLRENSAETVVPKGEKAEAVSLIKKISLGKVLYQFAIFIPVILLFVIGFVTSLPLDVKELLNRVVIYFNCFNVFFMVVMILRINLMYEANINSDFFESLLKLKTIPEKNVLFLKDLMRGFGSYKFMCFYVVLITVFYSNQYTLGSIFALVLFFFLIRTKIFREVLFSKVGDFLLKQRKK